MWITKLQAKQSWSFRYMLAVLAISILEVLKTTCMTCQWLIPLMIQNCSDVMILRNWAKGMALNIDGNFFVVTQVYLL
jgi:hypothetical protein